MVGSVVDAAADPFWGNLRRNPDDVFADELKQRVLESWSAGWKDFRL
jgi:hypothetical protein